MKITLIEANQDLGVKVDGAHLGPHILTSELKDENIEVLIVNKPKCIKEKSKENLKKNLDSINTFDKDLYDTCLKVKENNKFPLVIGGDHSIAIASSLASLKKEKSLGIIWIDAHGDYNTFETTRSGNLHGLPLAAVNDNCELLTDFHKDNFYNHKNTVIVGGRDIDPWEMPNLEKDGIKIFTTEDIKKLGVKRVMDEAIKIASNGTNGIHISYDIDVIDPVLAPGVSVPAKDGISVEEAFLILDELINNKDKIKSMDLVEFNPLKDKEDKTKKIAVDILKKVIKNFS